MSTLRVPSGNVVYCLQTFEWESVTDDENEEMLYFSPEQNNVVFASAVDGWGFGYAGNLCTSLKRRRWRSLVKLYRICIKKVWVAEALIFNLR